MNLENSIFWRPHQVHHRKFTSWPWPQTSICTLPRSIILLLLRVLLVWGLKSRKVLSTNEPSILSFSSKNSVNYKQCLHFLGTNCNEQLAYDLGWQLGQWCCTVFYGHWRCWHRTKTTILHSNYSQWCRSIFRSWLSSNDLRTECHDRKVEILENNFIPKIYIQTQRSTWWLWKSLRPHSFVDTLNQCGHPRCITR